MNPKLPSRIEETLDRHPDLGLLVLRLSAGLLLCLAHGLPKLLAFPEKAPQFSDPLHLTSPVSLGLAVFAEVFCALAVAAGCYTRLATLPVIFTMAMATFIVHADDPFKMKERAILFGILYLVILLTGPGKYALDTWLARKRRPG